jgi:6,7-dimethyl-8-ribityllumazine synthase
MGDAEPRVGVVVSRFNRSITKGLLDGALDTLRLHGVGDPTVVEVPGALELPVTARALIDAGHSCVVALGVVIQGETDHYEHVATQSIAGLVRVSTETGVPVGIGVLTVRVADHAVERSRPGPGNVGGQAAEAAMKTAAVIGGLAATGTGRRRRQRGS